MNDPWLSWYDLEGDAAEEAGITALLWFDDLAWADAIDEMDRILCSVDVSRLPSPIVIDVLNETYPFRERLQKREAFVLAATTRLTVLVGQERAALLMLNRA